MKVFLRLILIITVGALLFSSVATSEPIPEQVLKCVAYIVKPGSEESKNWPIGTGFFVGYKYEEVKDKTYVFLVTARHVIFDEKGRNRHDKLLIRLNDKKEGTAKDFDILKKNTWFAHEKEENAVDIVVHPLLPKTADFLIIHPRQFVREEIISEKNIGIGDELFYTGLLTYHSGAQKISPIVRFGKIALTTTEKTIDGKYYHFIDAGNIPGHSGSPVFLWATATRHSAGIVAGNRIFGLYGVVSGMLEYNKKLEATISKDTSTRKVIPMDARSGGVTLVVPIKFLIEILEGSNLKKLIGIIREK